METCRSNPALSLPVFHTINIMDIEIIIFGIVTLLIGLIGKPQPLNYTPNTATVVFLTGVIIIIIGLK